MRTNVDVKNVGVGKMITNVLVIILLLTIMIGTSWLLIKSESESLKGQIQANYSDYESLITSSTRSIFNIIFLMLFEFIVMLLIFVSIWHRESRKHNNKLQSMVEEVKMRDETFRILTTQSTRIVIKKNIVNGTIEILNEDSIKSSALIKKLHDNPDSYWTLIHPEDIVNELRAMESIKEGKVQEVHMSRLRINTEDYLWHKIMQVGICDELQTLTHIICVIENVHEEYLNSTALRTRAEKDTVTGLLNRATAVMLITEVIGQNVKGFMFILDIDNFKGINDRYGHQTGDIVLEMLANTLITIFSKEDIVGRFGGDEFIIYMKYNSDLLVVEKKIQKVREILNKLHEGGLPDISVSVGITFNDGDKDFQTLYAEADKALYKVKSGGKDGYVVVHNDLVINNTTLL